MIIAGVHYRSEEVDAGRRLLRELGQSERALRSVLEFVRRERVGWYRQPADRDPAGSRPRHARPVPTHRRIVAKRQALDRLARRWAELRRAIDPDYSWPQAQARVNRAMGVVRRADAGERQLDDGLAFLRSRAGETCAGVPRRSRATADPGQRRGDRRPPHGRDGRPRTPANPLTGRVSADPHYAGRCPCGLAE